jgi:hypothetical protein
MQLALYDQVLVEDKLRQLAQINHGRAGHSDYCSIPPVIPTQPASRADIAPEEVVRMLDSLSIT